MATERAIESAANHPVDNEAVLDRLVDVIWHAADTQQPPVHPLDLTHEMIDTAVIKSRSGLPSLEAIGRRFEHQPGETHEQAAIRSALARIALTESQSKQTPAMQPKKKITVARYHDIYLI